MPKLGPPLRKRKAYWWSEDLGALRERCSRARRAWLRSRRRNTSEATHRTLYQAYRRTDKQLKAGIGNAKRRAWEEFLASLNKDPWGRPYKNVIERLKAGSSTASNRLPSDQLKVTVDALFPRSSNTDSGPLVVETLYNEVSPTVAPVSENELYMALSGVKNGVAPGPDGVPNIVWNSVGGILASQAVPIFNACLKHGWFPSSWKAARLTLLRKPGREEDTPSAFRPLCILNETGKILERIIASRLRSHLEEVGPDLSDEQYGFRRGKSTIDAILRVRGICEEVVARGGKVIAVSLDIINAFNSLPHSAILEALSRHRIPEDLKRILTSFLEDRVLLVENNDGGIVRRKVDRGVPQGSILSPPLWNLGYDPVLQAPLPNNCWVLGYADDTFVVAGDSTWEKTIHRVQKATNIILEEIGKLGLKVSTEKSEAQAFYKQGSIPPPRGTMIQLRSGQIAIRNGMRYLGIYLDSFWRFDHHFKVLIPRTLKTVNALRGLMPNLGGPCSAVRRLYSEVIKSKILYGAPIWANDVISQRKLIQEFRSMEKLVATRIIRSYKTVARGAAMALAGFQPLLLLARSRRDLYLLRKSGLPFDSDEARLRMIEIRYSLYEDWRRQLEGEEYGRWTLDALLHHWIPWQEALPPFSYRLAQLVTGHGCFGNYLHRIGKEDLPCCHHCDNPLDTAEHTLVACTAWTEERRCLEEIIGENITQSSLLTAMIKGGEKLVAAWKFAELVIRRKEEIERDRERSVYTTGRPHRWRRGRPPRDAAE